MPAADDQLHAALLASLPGCGPARLTTLLAAHRTPADAWDAVIAGRGSVGSGAFARAWREHARSATPAEVSRRLDELGVTVLIRGHAGYPPALDDDPEPPAVLFTTGSIAHLCGALAAPTVTRVAIVGTRRCTGYGRDVARTLGRDLADAGVTVVSGLAAGIDGAAHEGVLAAVAAASGARDGSTVPAFGTADLDRTRGALTRDGATYSGAVPDRATCDGAGEAAPTGGAPPIAVVGSGVDVVYPRRHRRLWGQVAEAGLVLSEAPLGAAPEPWRFPLRNRIIAGLSSVVVVVESHAGGGSMHTVQAAIDRGVPVMAVPGSVRSPSSVGTNRLLADGVPPVLDATDVLVALSLMTPTATPPTAPAHPVAPGRALGLAPTERLALDALDWSPTPTEDLLRRTGLMLGELSNALTNLEMAGLARRSATEAGTWERR